MSLESFLWLKAAGYTDPTSYLLAIFYRVSKQDLILMLILDIGVIVLVVFYPQLAASFDNEFAQVRGVPNILFLVI